MQNKTKIHDKFNWKTIFRAVQWLVPLLLCWLLYKKFFGDHSFSLEQFIVQFLALPWYWYVLLFLFTCLNWSLETFKWQILLQPLNPLSFGKALSSILAGVTISQLLPFKTGEYLGRMMYVRDDNKLNAVLLSIIGSYSQLLVTLICGIIGFIVLQPIPYTGYFIWLVSILIVAGFLFYYLLPGMLFSSGFKFMQKLQTALGFLTRAELLKVFGISFIRYCSFLLPYSLLAWYFGLSMNGSLGHHLLAVSCIFFLQTISPNFILTDIALRLTIPVIVFSSGNASLSDLDHVPGMIIYLFNVVLPMMLGSFLIMFARFKQS